MLGIKPYVSILLKSALVTSLLISFKANADLVPAGNSPLYYQISGGESIPIPANGGAISVPLNVDGDVGLGYNCGLFNPKLSITNSINNIENSFQNIAQSIVANATAAIAEFPMYAIARADPDLYNLLNNALIEARDDLNVSTKSCQVMQSEIAQGKNPYTDWATVSMGNDWKYHMSLASNSQMRGMQDDASGDINQVNQEVSQDNGDNGVPWVHGENIGRDGNYAGGSDQPAIYVTHDTAVAGYNVILQSGRNYDDESPPVRTSANAHLVDTWNNPKVAADWIVNVVGDEKITTFAGGNKQSYPGNGLLPTLQQLAIQLNQNLQNLVSGQTPVNVTNLQAVSAPGVAINPAVISALQQKDPLLQTILINKLSQEVAAGKLIDESLLARQLLEAGAQVPAIYGNKAAQTSIKNSLSRLDQAMNDLLMNVKVRKEFVSDTVTQLLESTQAQQAGNTAIQGSNPPPPLMNNGALPQTNTDEKKP